MLTLDVYSLHRFIKLCVDTGFARAFLLHTIYILIKTNVGSSAYATAATIGVSVTAFSIA